MLKARKVIPPRNDSLDLAEGQRLAERGEAVAEIGNGLRRKIIIEIRRQQAAVDLPLLQVAIDVNRLLLCSRLVAYTGHVAAARCAISSAPPAMWLVSTATATPSSIQTSLSRYKAGDFAAVLNAIDGRSRSSIWTPRP